MDIFKKFPYVKVACFLEHALVDKKRKIDYKEVLSMRILIVEDDMASRIFIKKVLVKYGECDIAIDGLEAIDAFLVALKEEKPYDLICMDIMMPKLDGMKALQAIREIEKQKGIDGDSRVKVIMTTALNDNDTIMNAYDTGCEAYAWKPIEIDKFVLVMNKLGLVE
jgi:two-component system chemotaxis response regulator CheY